MSHGSSYSQSVDRKKLCKTLSAVSAQDDDWILLTFVKMEVHVHDILISPTKAFFESFVHEQHSILKIYLSHGLQIHQHDPSVETCGMI